MSFSQFGKSRFSSVRIADLEIIKALFDTVFAAIDFKSGNRVVFSFIADNNKKSGIRFSETGTFPF